MNTAARRQTLLQRATMDILESRTLLASVAASTPYNGQQNVSVSANLTVRFGSAMNAASLTSTTVRLIDAAGNTVPSSLSYNASNLTLTIDPTSNLASSSNYYTLRVLGGANGVKDSGAGTLAEHYLTNFTTGAPNFSESTVFSGLINPTAIEFSPDGRIFVAEKRGVIKVFDSLTDTSPDIFADLRTKVHNYWDRGLLGMTLDPQFTTGRPFIYVLYTYDGDINGNAPKWGTANTDADPGASNGSSTVSGRLSKLTANGNAMSGNEQVLIHDWQNQFPSHSIGDLNFGPDGYLYASAGDGASFNAVDYGQTANGFNDPNNEGGAVRSQDIRSSGDPVTLDGTVIRIDPDTGAPAAGNPFASNSDTNAKRIIAYGLRNPYRFSFRPGTNEIWIAETGWNAFEEINRIGNTSDTTAENFGWPAYEGPNRQTGYDAANLPLLESLYSQGASAHNSPWFAYSHSDKVVPGSSEPTGGSSPTGIFFYTAGSFPSAYDGAMFFTDYSRKQIYVMYRGADGLPDVSTRQLFRSTTNGAVDLIQGPDGAIYYADLNGNRIQRIALVGQSLAGATKLPGTVIGSTGTTGNTRELAHDGNFTSYFYSNTASGGWTGIDAGSGRWVNKIRFAPRGGYAASMVGGKFQASNSATFASGVVDLYTVNAAPTNGQWSTVAVNPTGASYRYYRYIGADGTNSQIADVEFYAGEGLPVTYYDNMNFTGTSVTRVDPKVDFNWGTGTPATGIAADTFSARWQGKIHAVESGTYTFRTTSDDGVRLWVNNTLLIDKLVDQSSAVWSNTISLTAGQFYDIRVDYYENGGDAVMKLEWQRPGASFEVVPTSALYASGPSTNMPPVPVINSPAAPLNWKVGDVINFSGSASDSQDGALPASAISWMLVLMHGNLLDPNSTHEHIIQSYEGVASGSFVAPDHDYPSWIELRMTATDSGGETTTVTRRLDPATAQVTIASNPAGAALAIGTIGGTSTVTATVLAGSQTTLSTPASFISGGQTYHFTGWSDGGSPTHDITAPVGNVTYTATYALAAAPAAPTALVATSQSSTQINLSWSDNAGNETGYKIERRTGGGSFQQIALLGANVTTYQDTSLTAGTAYEYRVRAAGTTDSAYSNTASATTASVVTPPAAPTSLLASNVTTSSASLTWTDNANNESGYRVERRAANGAFATIATLAANTTSFNDAGLSAATAYEYRVRAFNTGGDSSASNAVGVTTLSGSTAPLAPTGLSGDVLAGPLVKLNWTDASSNETSFKVQRRYAGWVWEDLATVGANVATYTDTTAIGGVVYEYRVLAANAVGSSAFSNAIIVDTSSSGPVAPSAPTNLAATAASATLVNVSWVDQAATETGYKIERRLAGGNWAQIAQIAANSTTYADSAVTAGNTYEYRVRATNGSVDSAYSNTATATTPGGSGTVPNTPGNLTAVVTTRPNVQLNWNDNSSNENAFVIQRRYAGWIWGDIGTVGSNVTSFLDTSGISGVVYEYRVVAQGSGGSSPFSNEVIVSTT